MRKLNEGLEKVLRFISVLIIITYISEHNMNGELLM